MREIVVDSFAGGGGASEGIRRATGRDPDVAVNHDRIALAMHRINHPDTHHMVEDVWHVDPVSTCAGRPIGLFWMSPDCKHFSKAKGGKPRESAIRGLAWVGIRWIQSLPKFQRPRVLILENVEEFRDWGPLLEDGKPCPVQKGATFREFVGALELLGYKVDWRELRACDYGAPTIRKRLFLIARRDRQPIVWPTPTHAPLSVSEDGIVTAWAKGHGLTLSDLQNMKPWRTAAECIDWSLPCPSIFDSSETIKAIYGIRSNRPLADATMARIAKGTMRYVVNAARPFLVRVNHGDSRGRRDRGLDEPMPTATHYEGDALVQPFVTYGQQGGGNRDVGDPIHTLCASPKDQNAIAAAFLARHCTGAVGRGLDEPVNTVVSHSAEKRGGGASPLAIVSGLLVPRYGEAPGQEPRSRAIDVPMPVIVPTGNEGSLAAVSMIRQFGASVGSAADEPVGTITAGGAGKAGIVAAFLAQHNTDRDGGIKPGADVREPMRTVTASGGQQTVVAAFVAQHTAGSHPGQPAKSAEEPISTITGKGCQQGIVAAHMLNLRGSDRRGGPIDVPAPTTTGGGNHAATVYAFLAKYYGEGLPSQAADEPLHTVTAKPRHGLVTVTVDGEPYVVVDIGMRMLTPRERFNAQGFRPDYIIDRGELEDGTEIPLTMEQQGRACGNSVCPDLAHALVAANYREATIASRPAQAEPMPLFAAE